jgi:predicted MFS family arabinose efflux permease
MELSMHDSTLSKTTRPVAGTSAPQVALFAGASGLSVANVYYAQPLLDSLAAQFHISQAAVGAVVTATQLGSALALVLLIPLGDRLERKRLMLAQALALVVALICVALAGNSAVLLAGMLAVGMLGTAMTQGLIAYAATVAAPGERGHVVGAAQGGVVIGLLLSRVLAGLVADLGGWRWVYGLSAALMLALTALLWAALPRQPAPERPLPYAQLLLSMLKLLRQQRALQVRGLLAMLMFAAFSVFWSALALPLSAAPYSLSHSTIGAFGLVGIAGALAATRAGRWADRGWGQRTSLGALLLLLAAWPVFGLSSHSLAFMVLGTLMLDLAVQALQVTNQSMILQGSVQAHSRLIGCYMMFYAVGSGAGALAATAVYAAAGWAGVCWLGGGISVLALVFWAGTLRGSLRERW